MNRVAKQLRALAEEWWECCGDIHLPLLEAAREIDALARENKAWMNGVADTVEPFGFDREAACGPADLLPGLKSLSEYAALGREIEYEIERWGDPYLMGVRARVSSGDGFTQPHDSHTCWDDGETTCGCPR